MTVLASMPGGSEWIFVLLFLAFVIAAPILAIVFYIKNKELKKEIEWLRREKTSS